MRQYWENFVNYFFREATSTTRGLTILSLVILALVFLVLSIRGGKDKLVKNYLLFAFSILFVILAVAYTILSR